MISLNPENKVEEDGTRPEKTKDKQEIAERKAAAVAVHHMQLVARLGIYSNVLFFLDTKIIPCLQLA